MFQSVYNRFAKLMAEAGAALSPPRALILTLPLSSNSTLSSKSVFGFKFEYPYFVVVLIDSVYSWIGEGVKAAWGDLPPELCTEIGIRLSSRLDILRFRSVCKKWRLSLPLPTRFPLRVPPPPNCCLLDRGAPCYITEVSIAESILYPDGLKFDIPKHPLLSKLSFVSQAYHLRLANGHMDSQVRRTRGQWDFEYNLSVKKMVIISSNASGGINPSYARASDISAVAHLSYGRMYGRLALLRLGGSPENWDWDTGFCTRVFEDIATCRGRLCVLDYRGAVLVMDYNSLQMTQIAPPSSIPRNMKHKMLWSTG